MDKLPQVTIRLELEDFNKLKEGHAQYMKDNKIKITFNAYVTYMVMQSLNK